MKSLLLIFTANIFFLLNLANDLTSFIEPHDRIDSIKGQFESQIKEQSDNIKKMWLHYDYGVILDEEGEFELAAVEFNKALKIAVSATIDTAITAIANNLGNQYAMLGNFEQSTIAYLQALETAQKIGDAGEIAKISGNLAGNHMMIGDYEQAIDFALYAIQLKETHNIHTRICYQYIALANIFRETDNLKKWEAYVMKAYEMKDKEGCANIGDKAKIYNSLGGIAEQKNKLDKALLYYDTLRIISTEAGFVQGISTALINGADIYKSQNNYEKALEMATEAEQYFGEHPYDYIFSDNFKAELYGTIGEYQRGLSLAERNIKRSEINSYPSEKLKCFEILSDLHADLSDFKSALDWKDSAHIFENELRDLEKIETLEELETKYQTEKKEQKIDLLTAENEVKKRRSQLSISLVVVLLLFILLIIYISRVRKKQAELIQTDLEQQVLRSQMNPHFIFNVLGSIQNYMLANDTINAAAYLSSFASLTRATLEFSSEKRISLSDELEMLKNYIELEQMRMPGKFNYQIVTDENLESDFIEIPPMMIQPFIENSIKHGFKNINYQGELRIKVSDHNNYIRFEIEDNGIGISEQKETTSAHRSMAMLIFEKRRKLIQKRDKKEVYFERIDLKKVDQNQTGLKIIINLPVLEND